MTVGDLFETPISVRRTVWRRRDGRVEREEFERIAATDVPVRSRVLPLTKDRYHDANSR